METLKKIISIDMEKKQKIEVKEKLLADIKEPAKELEEPQTFYAKMKSFKDSSGKIRNKTIKQIHSEDASLAFSPKDIKYEDRVFKLHTPLHCKVDIEDGYYVIQNDQLGIVGTGDTFEGAIESFSEEFDFIVNHYRKLDENQMSPRIKRAKDILQIILIDLKSLHLETTVDEFISDYDQWLKLNPDATKEA